MHCLLRKIALLVPMDEQIVRANCDSIRLSTLDFRVIARYDRIHKCPTR